ncbi:MAG: hypothetical protein ONB23_09965 [candidate division KSB1 bacterium]|nr:hypothetical protein [candidate division KSB1 bacterium]
MKPRYSPYTGDVDQEGVQQLLGALRGKERVWLVLSRSHDPGGLLVRSLASQYPVMLNRNF